MYDPWIASMLRGDFTAAWQVSDRALAERNAQQLDCSTWPRHLQFIWRGQPLQDKRVLVRCYHGLGDTLQFVRLLAPLRELATEVILWAQPSLLPLLASVKGIDQLLPLHDGVSDIAYDVDVELMELPHILRLTADSIPAVIPYIRVPYVRAPPRISRCRAGLHDPLVPRVGVAWQSGDWNSARSIPRSVLERLAGAPNVRWHSLQYGAQCPFEAQPMACKEIHVMAERMTQLDLVISPDTMTAHLAGAIGLPIWLLLQHNCDWRWMSQGDRTPWYPTMRLFRQPIPGDWHSVVERVLDALRDGAHLTPARDTRSVGCITS